MPSVFWQLSGGVMNRISVWKDKMYQVCYFITVEFRSLVQKHKFRKEASISVIVYFAFSDRAFEAWWVQDNENQSQIVFSNYEM